MVERFRFTSQRFSGFRVQVYGVRSDQTRMLSDAKKGRSIRTGWGITRCDTAGSSGECTRSTPDTCPRHHFQLKYPQSYFSCSTTIKRMWHTKDRHGLIICLSCIQRSSQPFEMSPLRSEADTQHLCLTESVHIVVLQESISARIRQLILYIGNNEG